MKQLFMIGALYSLAGMVLHSPAGDPTTPDGEAITFPNLDASLKAEGENKNLKQDFQTGLSRPSRGLGASLAAEGAVAEALSLGLTGKVIPVSKLEAEGLLMIDGFTGRVIPDQEDTPEWASELGLIHAVLGERHIFYSTKLGPLYTAEHKMPEVLAFEDLDWLALDPNDGHEKVYEADDEFRMEVRASILGINRSEEEGAADIEGITAYHEIALDNTRTGEQMAAFTEAQKKGFEEAATGTAG